MATKMKISALIILVIIIGIITLTPHQEVLESETGCCKITYTKHKVIYQSPEMIAVDYIDEENLTEDIIAYYQEHCYKNHYVTQD